MIAHWLGWWLALLVFYLLLAVSLTVAEVVVGAMAAALSATVAVITIKVGSLYYRPQLRWLRPLSRLPWRVLTDSVLLCAALWRRVAEQRMVEGSFHTIRFDPGGDDCVSRARRALVIASISMAPNTIVVHMDQERGIILVHQLVPTSTPPGGVDKEWPL
jgi:multisubunit Na+/H+ antiporter MnhE subunit